MKVSFFYLLPLIISSIFRCVSNIGIVINKIAFQAIMMLVNGVVNVIAMFILIKFSKLGIYSIVITTFTIIIIWYGIVIPIYISKKIKCSVVEFYKTPMIVFVLLILYYLLILSIKAIGGEIRTWSHLLIEGGMSTIFCLCIFGIVFIIYNKKIIKHVE